MFTLLYLSERPAPFTAYFTAVLTAFCCPVQQDLFLNSEASIDSRYVFD
jgi:hypothetical protein